MQISVRVCAGVYACAGVFVARCANFDKVYIIIIAESSCRSCCTSGIIFPVFVCGN